LKSRTILEKLSTLNKSTEEKQNTLTLSEANCLWLALGAKYDALNITNILSCFVKDGELKKFLSDGINLLIKQIKALEKILKNYGIPMPNKPPEQSKMTIDKSTISDETIYREIFKGIRNMQFTLLNNFTQSSSSTLKDCFKSLLLQEMDLYAKISEYGKLKVICTRILLINHPDSLGIERYYHFFPIIAPAMAAVIGMEMISPMLPAIPMTNSVAIKSMLIILSQSIS